MALPLPSLEILGAIVAGLGVGVALVMAVAALLRGKSTAAAEGGDGAAMVSKETTVALSDDPTPAATPLNAASNAKLDGPRLT